jgi:hypothetical protein
MLDPIQYEFLFLFTTLADPEPELLYSSSNSGQKLRLLAAPAPQHCKNAQKLDFIRSLREIKEGSTDFANGDGVMQVPLHDLLLVERPAMKFP